MKLFEYITLKIPIIKIPDTVPRIILELLVNGGILFFVFSAFVNIDLLRMHQIAIISIIVINGYLLNKKILRSKDCKVSLKQIFVALGFGLFNFGFLLMVSKIF